MTPEAEMALQLETEAKELLEYQIKEAVEAALEKHQKDEDEKWRQLGDKLKIIHDKLEAIEKLFLQGETVLKVFKWIGAGLAALWAIILWARDHIKL